ncbi:MAG TPA: hypothetical protein VFP53_07170 [Sphingomicrobium sp.]|nr:hypothetical protein [Sphingomicrobium sp.]
MSATQSAPEPSKRIDPEPVTRLASIRNALRVVDDFGGGPAPDFDEHAAEAWDNARAPARRCFDRRSAELVAVATAGLETVSFQREQGLDTSVAAMRVIADELRAGLLDIQKIFSR